MFQQIPASRPDTPLLDSIAGPADLKNIPRKQLAELAEELRAYLLYCVGQTGGHFGAGLGVVELSIALHYVYNTPDDRLVWDVGHQAYPHKILTGRREQMLSMRQRHGLAPFPKREESEFDTFGVGHAGTSISAALGMAIANKIQGNERKVVAIIGDGAITAGMAYEALNHSIEVEPNLLVVLNDNAMSISHNTGGMARYFARILASKTYTTMREGSKKVLSRIPHAWEFARRTEEHVKGMLVPGTLFEELGFNYIGPVDGHDMENLLHTLENVSELEGPQFLHIITRKGHGYEPAMEDPVGQHAISKLEPGNKTKSGSNLPIKQKFAAIFGQWLYDIAAEDERVMGITPAMREGSDLIKFSETYPERYFDVAIAEQHAVTLAAGLACEGCKPVVAIYSTFLQRAYDQLIHDVAIQNLDVLFAIDRAGVVGEDGPTHMGGFDLSFLRCIPNLIVMTPSDENLCRQMLYTGHQHTGPAAVRYPRGTGPGASVDTQMYELPIGKARIVRQSHSDNPVVILAFGPLLQEALVAATSHDAIVVDMQFVKPLDEQLIAQLAPKASLLVTLEDNTIRGGAGSAVLEYLSAQHIVVPSLCLGWPDEYVEHGNAQQLLKEYKLDATGIQATISQQLAQLAQTTQ